MSLASQTLNLKRQSRRLDGPSMLDMPEPATIAPPLTPPSKSTRRVNRDPVLVPARPELEKFRDNLVRGMIAKNMTASDVARAMWGEKKNALGNKVAKGRDRMTHYLSGGTYPNEVNVAKLAEILGLGKEDLAMEPEKAKRPSTTVPPDKTSGTTRQDTHPEDASTPMYPTLTFQMRVPGYVDVTFRRRIPRRWRSNGWNTPAS